MLCLVGLGAGMGTFQPPNNNAIFASVPPSEHGVSAALTNLARNIGQTFGVALARLIATITMSHAGVSGHLSSAASANDPAVGPAFTSGMRNAFFAAAGLLPIALIASLARGKGGGETAEAPAPAVTVTAAKPETAALSAAGPNTRSLS